MYKTSPYIIGYEKMYAKVVFFLYVAHFVSSSHPIWKSAWDSFVHCVQQESAARQELDVNLEAKVLNANEVVITCTTLPEGLSDERVGASFKHRLSTIVSDFMIDVMEKKIVMHALKQNHPPIPRAESEKIYEQCRQMLWMADEDILSEKPIYDAMKVVERKNQIFKKAYAFFEEGHVFSFDGFLRFRLKEYYQDLLDTLEFAIDEYVLNEEYQEFIQLLRRVIAVQKCKIPLLHVIHIQDRLFQLLDEEGNQVSAKTGGSSTQEWFSSQPIHQEELIVSSLITLAPKEIILHTNHGYDTIVQTLTHIFEERISVCLDCEQCRKWIKA